MKLFTKSSLYPMALLSSFIQIEHLLIKNEFIGTFKYYQVKKKKALRDINLVVTFVWTLQQHRTAVYNGLLMNS